MKIPIFLLSIIVIAASCNQNENTASTIVVDPEKSSPINYSELFDGIEYVYLAPIDNKGYISEIDKLVFDGSNFYVFQDVTHAPSIFKFDRSGKFVFSKTSREEGPGKFIGANDILLNSSDNTIEVLDAYQAKIVACSQKDGRFLNETNLPFNLRQFVGFGKEKYAFYSGNDRTEMGGYNVYLMDEPTTNLRPFIPINEYLIGTGIENKCFSSFPNNGSFLYRDEFSNIIWRITPDEAEEAYVIDFGGNWFDEKTLHGLAVSDAEGKLAILNSGKDKIRSLICVEEFESSIFFKYYLSGRMYWNFFDKNSMMLSSFFADRVSSNNPNNIDGGPIPNRFLGRFKDYMIFEAKSDLVYRLGQTAPSGSKFKQLAQTVPEEGNPVIILAKLKKKYQ